MVSEDQKTVPVVCPDCDTETEVPLSDLADTLERHNENRHDGDAVAEVDPAVSRHVQDLVAEELGLLED